MCPRHTKETRREIDQRRGSAASRGYGYQWSKFRLIILARDPVCVVCKDALSTVVDHQVAKVKGGQDSEENCRGLCASCHGRKSAVEDARWG